MCLKAITFKLYSFDKIISNETMRIVYMSLYQSIYVSIEYGIIVWGGTTDNILNPLNIQQNKTVHTCLKK